MYSSHYRETGPKLFGEKKEKAIFKGLGYLSLS